MRFEYEDLSGIDHTFEHFVDGQRIRQPVPHFNPGGDCFACALCAGLRTQCVNISIEETVDLFRGESVGGKPCFYNSWDGYPRALAALSETSGLEFDTMHYLVKPSFKAKSFNHSFYGPPGELKYTYALYRFLRMGYLAIGEINSDPVGPMAWKNKVGGDYHNNYTNHAVLLNGAKSVYRVENDEEGNFKFGSWDQYIHVTCSSKKDNGTGWFETKRLTKLHGLAAWFLFRPKIDGRGKLE